MGTEQVQLLAVSVETLQRSIHTASAEAEAGKQMKATDSVALGAQDYTLADFENNFSRQIDMVLKRLDRFRPAQPNALKHFSNEAPAFGAQASIPHDTGITQSMALCMQKDPLLANQMVEDKPPEQDVEETGSQHTDTQHYERHDVPGYDSLGKPVRASQLGEDLKSILR